MTRLYKLTNQDGYTYNQTHWEVGKTNTLPPVDHPRFCSSDVLHAYSNLDAGLLLNPQQADFTEFRVFEVEGEVVIKSWGKVGCFSLQVIRELDIPEWYADEQVRKRVMVQFAYLCAREVLPLYLEEFPDDTVLVQRLNAVQESLTYNTPLIYATNQAVSAACTAVYKKYGTAQTAALVALNTLWAADSKDVRSCSQYAAKAAVEAVAAKKSINIEKLAEQAIMMVTGK